MNKLKLPLESLAVETFHTTAAEMKQGTVFGEQCTCATYCTCPGMYTCGDLTCPAQNTCGDTCDGWTCVETCGVSNCETRYGTTCRCQ